MYGFETYTKIRTGFSQTGPQEPRPGEIDDKQVQEEPEISTSPTQGQTRENLPRRCRVTGPHPKTPEVKSLRTYAQVLAQEDNEINVPNRGRYLPMNFCTNSAFPQVTNRNNNNNDENSATNSGQNEQCKTFVGTPINIDMKCLDEFSVIYLSDYSLNQTDLRLLSKGLTFTPTPDVTNIGEIKSDLDSFLRKIRLRLYFSEEISEDEPSSSSSPTQTQVPEFEDTLIRKFRNKSNWSPKNQDAQVETYIRTVITEFQKLKLRNPPKTNLTQEEKQRLNLLQNNQHIVVKPADKGSAIVIMNRTDYITEATRQLSDTKFYTKTQVDLTGTHINKITQTLSTMLRNDEIAQSVYRNLVPKDCKTPAFYFLPKIHKQKITGRPIISGNNCPTEKISAFIDEHIKQFVPHIKSYVRDTPDFIKKIENFKLNGDYFLVTMDVTSLYTNIPNHEGLVAVTQTLIRENAQFRANNRSLITLLQHVLHMNNFQFNGENYLQIGGTAMGTRVAPSYANLFMARLEEKLLADS